MGTRLAPQEKGELDLKIIAGVGIPLLAIILLVLASTLGAPIVVERIAADSVLWKDLYYEHGTYGGSSNRIVVEQISISNTNDLPRKHELQPLVACVDSESEIFRAYYSQGERVPDEKAIPVFGRAFVLYNRYGEEKTSVEMGGKSTKTVDVLVQPRAVPAYRLLGYREGSNLLLFEKDKDISYYGQCSSYLDRSDLTPIARIPIIRS
jgi:hypothetical protein